MTTTWIVFCKDAVLLYKSPTGLGIFPKGEKPPVDPKPWTHIQEVYLSETERYCAFETETPPCIPGHELVPLRASYYYLSEESYRMAGKARELLYWDSGSRFCGTCGAPMQFHTSISKRCTNCGREIWPPLATAIIVRITKGDQILLVRARNFRSDFYGLVAGFVETGEDLEQAVRRETAEETGISIRNIRYFASQPWPYPAGIMVGFTAEYADGTVRLQHEELASGGWFDRENLPNLPEPLSIARWLIDDWLKQD